MFDGFWIMIICFVWFFGLIGEILLQGLVFCDILDCNAFDGNFLPNNLVDNTNLNWFGAVLASLGLLILCPIIWIIDAMKYACTKH